MEQEGIYYYFTHENGKHMLVLSDAYSSHKTFPGYAEVPYFPPDVHDRRTRDHLFEWVTVQQVQPGAYALNDFDFKAPRKDLQAVLKRPKSHTLADFEMYDYPGEYTDKGDGSHYSKIRLQELHAQHEIAHGRGNAGGLAAGYLFSLTQCSREDQNREYLIISAVHRLESDQYESVSGAKRAGKPYRGDISAIDAKEHYRAARLTPKPLMQGPQTAIVVGKAGEEIWTDQWGRVKVKFHWDRYSSADENSSCWIRVAQVWANRRWGAIHIPRIGEEVIVDFLEGDPDQPIITGRVYNMVTMPPYPLPQNATITTIKTNSSKGGAGFNEIRFEDKKGEEQVFIHAEKNQDIRVKKDCFEWIGQDRHLIVKKDQFEHVKNDSQRIVDSHHNEKIGSDLNLKVGGKQAIQTGGSYSLTVNGNVMEVFQNNHSEQTSNAYYLKAMQVVIESMTGITLKCGGSHVTIDSSGVTIKGPMVTVEGGLVKIASGPGSPPLSGSAGSAVAPKAPEKAQEADNADPGEVAKVKAEQRQKGTGKYGKIPITPFKPDNLGGAGDRDTPDEQKHPQQDEQDLSKKKKKSWIEIVLVDEEDNPVPGEEYEIVLPDKTVQKGSLDEKGFARVDGVEPGNCEISFPKLDRDAWKRA